MELLWVITGFFILITIIFLVLAFAYPEWFGITGKKALEVQREHTDDAELAKNTKD